MAHCAQAAHCGIAETPFHQQAICGGVRHGGLGAVLNMLPAGRLYRFLQSHIVVNEVDQHLHIALHLAVCAGRAQGVQQPATRGGAAIVR